MSHLVRHTVKNMNKFNLLDIKLAKADNSHLRSCNLHNLGNLGINSLTVTASHRVHFFNTCHVDIMYINVYLNSGGMAVGRDSCQASDHCSIQVSTFVSVKPLDIFEDTSRQFSQDCGNGTGYFKRNHDPFLILTNWVLKLKTQRKEIQNCDISLFTET